MYQWWREKKDRFPLLYICFLAVFSMPGSEIEAERIFSICGILTQLRRNRMSDHMLDKLVYINKNYPNSRLLPPVPTEFPATLEQLVAAERDNVEQLEAEVEDDMDLVRDAVADQAWMDDLAAALDDLEPMDLAD